MLSSLYIQNLAVIEKAEFELKEGFNVFTGETGAGKTILINAMNAVSGGRIYKDIIRNGAEKAVITATFSGISEKKAKEIEEYGYELEDDELIVTRTITLEGKNICRINGQPATVSVLRDITQGMLDIYGQHDGRALLDAQEHIGFIDSYGALEGEIEGYKEIYDAMKNAARELKKAEEDEQDKDRLRDMLEYRINEISSANLREGEKDELIRQRDIIKNAEKLEGLFAQARAAALGEDDSAGALSELSNLADSTEELVRYYPELEKCAERLREIYYETEELYSDIRGCDSGEEYNPAQLDAIEDRLELISRLEKKYGGGEKEVLESLEEAQRKLEDIEGAEERIEELRTEKVRLLKMAEEKAEELSQKRKSTAEKFAEAVVEELRFLDMPSVIFTVRAEETELTATGKDFMEFMISANPGEPPRAMAKIASGGEMSRIMLSIKNALADKDEIETMVFDEVDTGVSGKAAHKIGKKLKSASKNRQVICVTHLAQVAAFGDRHLLIRKETEEGRAFTRIYSLEGEERVHEIARIGGGEKITETQLQNAREMLETGREK